MTEQSLEERMAILEAELARMQRTHLRRGTLKVGDRVNARVGRGDNRVTVKAIVRAVGPVESKQMVVVEYGDGMDLKMARIPETHVAGRIPQG